MANEKWLKVIDYDAVRDAFEEEYKKTRKLIESGETHLDNLAEGFTEADMVLRKMLNVDAVEVVRCRDCKHYEPIPNMGRPMCTKFLGLTIPQESPICSPRYPHASDGNG